MNLRFCLLAVALGCTAAPSVGEERAGLRSSYTIGYGGPPTLPGDFEAPTDGCSLVDLEGPADGFYPGTSEVLYVKSFDFGTTLEAQLVVTVGPSTTGTFDLAFPDGVEGEPTFVLFHPTDDGADVYVAVRGVVTVTGLPSSGEANFHITNLKLALVDNGTQEVIEDGPCLSFFTFDIDGFAEIPSGWTCSSDAYTNAVCDCGCGIVDPACRTASERSCGVCNGTGSCNEGARNCSFIDDDDNSQCARPEKPRPRPERISYETHIFPILENNCDGPGCHLLEPPAVGIPSLDRQNLLDSGLVVPGSLAMSPLWTEELEPGAMPLNGMLTDDELMAFSGWITGGALP
ncbi:MAG: hypothetical protein AAGE52_05955 [Myxococcota bacterium]